MAHNTPLLSLHPMRTYFVVLNTLVVQKLKCKKLTTNLIVQAWRSAFVPLQFQPMNMPRFVGSFFEPCLCRMQLCLLKSFIFSRAPLKNYKDLYILWPFQYIFTIHAGSDMHGDKYGVDMARYKSWITLIISLWCLLHLHIEEITPWLHHIHDPSKLAAL